METVFILIYMAVGYMLKVNDIITQPAYWSLYGFICGVITTAIIVINHKE